MRCCASQHSGRWSQCVVLCKVASVPLLLRSRWLSGAATPATLETPPRLESLEGVACACRGVFKVRPQGLHRKSGGSCHHVCCQRESLGRGAFLDCSCVATQTPFRLVPPSIVEPPVLCFALCVAFLLRVCVAFLLELTELAESVEMPCLGWNTRSCGPRSEQGAVESEA